MSQNLTVSFEDSLAFVTLTAAGSKVNILNSEFIDELEKTATELGRQTSIRGVVVISSLAGGFIAGADIGEIEGVTDPDEGAALAARGQRVFELWDKLPFPVVAAIHGHCMGGGTEFALSCRYRIAAQNASIALPEVKLGILPGFGGTQRLPRLISLEKALDIILSGRNVKAREALDIGLVDRLTDTDNLRDDARRFLSEVVADARPVQSARKSKTAGLRSLLLEKNPIGRSILFNQARSRLLKKTGGHYPAPVKALEVMERGIVMPLDAGLELEARALGEMIVTPESKNLVHLFHLSQRPKKQIDHYPGGKEINKAAVLGAGVMGGGIAHLLVSKGIPTILKDINREALDAGIEHARLLFRKDLKRKNEPESALERKMSFLSASLDYNGFGDIDLAIEAVVEQMAIKQSVLNEVEQHITPDAVFASNTSALSISELQHVARYPDRIGGLHFFNPVHKMPLVEVVRGPETSDPVVGALLRLAIRIGKTPIVTGDSTGFLVNRLLVTYLLEAALIATDGVNWQSLDSLATRFGFPMGPFRLVDEVGLDIAAEVGDTLCRSFSYLQPTDLLHNILERGFLGKKGGEGFYEYDDGRARGANPAIDSLLSAADRQAGTTELKRLMYLMVNEAGRCLQEEVVSSPEDIDTGMVFGTGFPPFRGGLCRWADAEGLPEIVRTLSDLAQQHGQRFEPCSFLVERKRFY